MRVAVIGGGIVGCSAALRLAEHGAEVVVVERATVAGEASGLNGGIIGGGGWGRTPDAEVTLKMGSRDHFVDLAHRRGHDIGLDLTGTLTLIRTAQEWDWASATVAEDRRAGRRLELLSSEDLRSLEPSADPALLGAILDPLGARAEPVAATEAFAAEARAFGAEIMVGREVADLVPLRHGGWDLHLASHPRHPRHTRDQEAATHGDAVGADAVILAAGPWCADLGAMVGVEIPIVPVRGQMWTTAPRPPLLRHAITAAESPLAWTRTAADKRRPPHLTHRDGRRFTRHVYGRQRPSGEIVFGGDRELTVERSVDPDGISVNHAHVAELVPPLGGLRPTATWTGLMPFSLDGAPVIGPVPGCDGLFVAGGLASSGFGRGPMAGQVVADLVLGRPPAFAEWSTAIGGDRSS